RERVLASTQLTRNGGISSWVLINPADPHKILSSCETIKKDALISEAPVNSGRASMVRRVTAHAVGSVFTPTEQRGNGYAANMLRLLAETMKRGNPAGFNVLYSDIGKKFYAKRGWMPHRSSHIEFPATGSDATIPGTNYIRSADVASLCIRDISALKDSLSRPCDHFRTKVAFVPDYQTMEWHWTREEFVGLVLRKFKPEIKGVITTDGKRWMIWCRDFGKTSQLYIIRYVNLSSGQDDTEEEEQVSNLIRAAGLEARKWGLQKVTLWNPDGIVVKAARRAAGLFVRIIERETDSICSLMMHHDLGSGVDEIDWEANEKFAWC
ncbi:hypothetical protein BDD12DRAFT_755913, partial [Trichophaea hybrida]